MTHYHLRYASVALLTFFLFANSVYFTGCPDEPPQEAKIQKVRAMLLELIEPPRPGQQSTASSFKEVLLRHSEAIYYSANQPKLLDEAGIPKQVQDLIREITTPLEGRSLAAINFMMKSASDGEFESREKQLNDAISKFGFAADALSRIQIPDIGANWTGFLRNVLGNYFSQLELSDRKRILVSLIKNTNSASTATDQLLVLVSASGPFFQKYMQLLADFIDPQGSTNLVELKNSLGKVKSTLPSIDPYYIESYLKELESKGIKLQIIRSLGAASVGEAFLARQFVQGENGPKKPIVIKFMRPDIDAIAQREFHFFKAQAAAISPFMKASFEQIAEQIFEELDFRTELQKLKRGAEVYGSDSSLPIAVVKPLPNFPEDKRWLAMEFASGKTLDKARGKISDESQDPLHSKVEMLSKALLLDMFAQVFMEKAFFLKPDGFFHGDLHGGNLILSIDDAVYNILKDKGVNAENIQRRDVEELINMKDKNGDRLIKLILIDFGNAHYLKSPKNFALFNLFISAAQISNSVSAFLDELQELSPEQKLDRAKLEPALARYFDPNENFLPHQRIGKAMDTLMTNEVIVPGVIVALIRTLGMLSNNFEQLASDATKHDYCFENLSLSKSIEDSIMRKVLGGLDITQGKLPHLNISQKNLTSMLYNFAHGEGKASFNRWVDYATNWWPLAGKPVSEQPGKRCELEY